MSYSRRLITLLFATTALSSGCLRPLPEVPRYRPPVGGVEQSGDSGEGIWEQARGHRGTIDDLDFTRSTPSDERLRTMIERVGSLRDEAERTRDEQAREILADIAMESDDDRRALLTTRLADLVLTGLSPQENATAVAILDPSIVRWLQAGTAAMSEGRFEQALDYYTWATHAAADGRHPLQELEAMVLARRLMAQQASETGDDSDLPARVLAYTLAALVKHHVDRPSWRVLVDGGFAALEQTVRSAKGASEVRRLQRRFEGSVASADATRSTIDRALEDLGDGLVELTRNGSLKTGQDAVRIFLEGMLATTDVRTDVFYGEDAAMFRRMLDDSYIGIGTTLTLTPEGIELAPVAGGPARRAGIATGDLLVAVDGTSVVELGLRGATERILGARDTEVTLSIRRRNRSGESVVEDVQVRRDEVERELVHGWRQLGPNPDGRPLWDWVVDSDQGIAYIGIREFTENTDRRFRVAMREANRELAATKGEAQQVEGLILDLRNNRGGRRDSTERLLDLFLSTGPLFETVDGSDRTRDRTPANPRTTRLDGLPVVVIVDEQSASAAEILAGTLQARSDALVVGERSYGKGSVQAVLPQPDGFLLVTESWFLVPVHGAGSRLVDRLRADLDWGVLPDISSAASESETISFLEERSDWNSNLDEDGFDFGDLPTLDRTRDRPLLDAVILLRSRLLERAGTSTGPNRVRMPQPDQ